MEAHAGIEVEPGEVLARTGEGAGIATRAFLTELAECVTQFALAGDLESFHIFIGVGFQWQRYNNYFE